ncbi:16S rRNA methyltransferase [Pseudidiomarina salinarum]|uniref:Ribosomal RNA small subunit methyltransferase G n=1 Tax=Pseudidiomarina salinarum TaxID=435908 RepID=A0A094ITG0_9GAMM|nr:16S rRNA (guanine(527)-N(7))-methyltransferase RsmG [Pseudidiomarina salinarum]KFZ30965.1 16S rRNA methyltransferase [Pseudidiomarina salinarum]RUO71453.1 16S rRNA (guanine(527)-N(7))-methyltransferase RsmG [Pseudidiomarina salinarum]
MRKKLDQLLAQAGIELTDQQLEQQLTLVEQLNKWNKAYNLTSVRDPEQMLSRHIVDSLVVLPYLQGQRFIDVGTGPGLPGLPLAIARPDCEFVLLDSLGKRIRFIRQVCHQLQLTNVTAVQSRVEDYQPDSKFDGVISRAFASLNDMLSWCRHLPGAQGRYLALKGVYPTEELAQFEQTFGTEFEIEAINRLQVPGAEGERHLVIIKTRG